MGPGEAIGLKNQHSKISWHCPFKLPHFWEVTVMTAIWPPCQTRG